MCNVVIERATDLLEQERLKLVRCYREKKCNVTLSWDHNFWVSRIFLDRDEQWHCRTMEE